MELRFSLEKLVRGVRKARTASWMVEKSSMQFCRSRMLRKKSLENSGAGLMVRALARGGPLRLPCQRSASPTWTSGSGCRVRKLGTMTKNNKLASGSTGRRYGSTHKKVQTNKKESVWVGSAQVNRWMSRFWRMKATPMRELKRRKLDDMVGMEKLGRATYVRERRSLTRVDEDASLLSELSDKSSVGKSCERRLLMLMSETMYAKARGAHTG